jgi:hypothetical protein
MLLLLAPGQQHVPQKSLYATTTEFPNGQLFHWRRFFPSFFSFFVEECRVLMKRTN